MKLKAISIFIAAILTSIAHPALADAPKLWGINMQDAASPLAERIHGFHDMMLYIIITIALFVLALLIWVIIRYNHKANPVPRQFTHNSVLEVVWTFFPILILVCVAVPSLRLLYYVDRSETPEMTLKIVGNQWYWNYTYPDNGNITFDSYMVSESDLKDDQKRLLSTDTQVVLPIETDIQLLVSAGDVLHSWAIPSFGVKMDGVPGRWNEAWVRINKPGTYYGQCSEICGKDHSFMPIEVKAVSKEDFAAWTQANSKEAAYIPYDKIDRKMAAIAE